MRPARLLRLVRCFTSPPALHLRLPCWLIIFSWAGSRCLSQILWPRRVKRQGNRNETLVFYQLSCQQGPTSNIFPQIQATPSHLKAVGSRGASYSQSVLPQSLHLECSACFSLKKKKVHFIKETSKERRGKWSLQQTCLNKKGRSSLKALFHPL